MFNKKPELYFDLGDEKIKIIQSKVEEDNVKLEKFKIINTKDLINKGNINKVDELAEKISEAIKKEGIKGKNCVCGISDELIKGKEMTLSSVNKNNLYENIKWNIEEEFSISPETVVFDYDILNINKEKKESKVYVMTVNKQKLKKYYELFEALELNLLSLEPEIFSAYNLINKFYDEKTIAVLDVGEQNSTLSIFHNGDIYYHKNLSVNGKILNEKIIEQYGEGGIKENGIETVNDYKKYHSVLTDELFDDYIANLINDLDKYLHQFKVKYLKEEMELNKLVITGGGLGKLNNLRKLADPLNLEVKTITPQKFVKYIGEEQIGEFQLSNFYHLLVNNFGMNFNYNKHDFRLDKEKIDYIKKIQEYLPEDLSDNIKISPFPIAYGLLLISIIFTGMNAKNFLEQKNKKLSNENQYLNKKTNEINDKTKNIQELKEEFKEKKLEIKKSNEIVGKKINWNDVIEEFNKVLPNNSWIKEFRINNHKQFEIIGYTFKQQNIHEIKSKLKKSNYFLEPVLQATYKKRLKEKNNQMGVGVDVNALAFKFIGEINEF